MSRNNIITYSTIKDIIERVHGKLLTSENNYINGMSEINIQCQNEHTWKTDGGHIKAGNWCPICVKKPFNDIKVFIEKKGGKILISESEYKNCKTPFSIECENGHVWNAAWNNISHGRWCPACNGGIKLTLDQAKKIAEERGGRCLSTEYKNINEPMLWECGNGHTWATTFMCIKTGTWCPVCNVYVSEEICRQYFEQLFNNKFPKVKPKFLINKDTGRRLELDGFCEQLNIAFEHHGEQHYRCVESYNDTEEVFNKRLRRDNIKLELCKINNIKIIIIPQLIKLTPLNALKSFIKNQCVELGVTIPPNYDSIEVKIDNKKLFMANKLEKYINVIETRGGTYLSGEYINNKSKILCKCKNNHIFDISCGNVLSGKWCRKCFIKSTIKNFSRELLSDFYINKKMTLTAIAKELNTTIENISNLLHTYGIRIINRQPQRMPNPFIYEDLYKLFVLENKTTSEIGRVYNKDHTAISRALKRFNIVKE